MKRLNKVIHSGLHKICAPVSDSHSLKAAIDIIAQHIVMRARFGIVFIASKVKPLIFKYLRVESEALQFRESSAKALIVSYLGHKSESCKNVWAFSSPVCSAAIASYLKSACRNIVVFSSSAARISCGRFRLLSDMDDSALSVFDSMALEDADYIFLAE